MVMTINVSPLANTPYDSIWDEITDDLLYFPTHLLADDDGATDILDSNSTLASAPAFTIDGTSAGTGTNSGWFTAQGDNRAVVASNAVIDAFCRSDTMATGQSIIISFWIYIPAATLTSENFVVSYGRVSSGHPGFYLKVSSAEKPQLTTRLTDDTQITSGVGSAITAQTVAHVMGVITKTTTGFACSLYQDGAAGPSNSGTGDSWGIQTQGLGIYAGHTNAGLLSTPCEANVQISDVIIARTSTDKTADMPGLASHQANSRTSLARAWADVL